MAAGSLPPNDGVARNAAQQLNRAARRDPQLYPLMFIMLGVVGVGGYFLTNKAGNTAKEPAHHLMPVGAHPDAPNSPLGPRVVAGENSPSSRVDAWKKAYKRDSA
ncbi:hypothetical protein DL93DRAFT_2231445 [Clavulina sp. PMI_390]|nr:hypothetical protein DL93DRAFT_2231445 [Clavulina sp. PMI_390]